MNRNTLHTVIVYGFVTLFGSSLVFSSPLKLHWDSDKGHTYHLQTSPDLHPPDWSDTGLITEGTGESCSIIVDPVEARVFGGLLKERWGPETSSKSKGTSEIPVPLRGTILWQDGVQAETREWPAGTRFQYSATLTIPEDGAYGFELAASGATTLEVDEREYVGRLAGSHVSARSPRVFYRAGTQVQLRLSRVYSDKGTDYIRFLWSLPSGNLAVVDRNLLSVPLQLAEVDREGRENMVFRMAAEESPGAKNVLAADLDTGETLMRDRHPPVVAIAYHVNMTVVDPKAYELEDQSAHFRLTFQRRFDAVIVPLYLSVPIRFTGGHADPLLGIASLADVEITAMQGNSSIQVTQVGDQFQLQCMPGGLPVDVYVRPRQDSIQEVPEFYNLQVLPGWLYQVAGGTPGTVETQTHVIIDDNDVLIGSEDMESFDSNPVVRFSDPGTAAGSQLSNGTLEMYFRVNGASCERDIQVRLKDPAGNIVALEAPYTSCAGPGSLYHIVLEVTQGAFTGSPADWELSLRDTDDQNLGAAEYSLRFARLTYDTTTSIPGIPGGLVEGCILEATNIPENERFFAGVFLPCGPDDEGRGVSTLQLRGDNSVARITTDTEGFAEGDTPNRVLLFFSDRFTDVLYPAELSSHPWTIGWNGSGVPMTNQEILDALLGYEFSIKVGVFSDPQPPPEESGELCAQLGPADGSYEPPDYSIYPTDMTLADLPTDQELHRDVVRFLMQATFGATEKTRIQLYNVIKALDFPARPGASGEARRTGYLAWIAGQTQLPPIPKTDMFWWGSQFEFLEEIYIGTTNGTYNAGVEDKNRRRHHAWADTLYARGQLRERAMTALSEIFVVSAAGPQVRQKPHGQVSYNEMLAQHAFGNYRDLLYDVSLHPIMATYLSHRSNRNAYDYNEGLQQWEMVINADENYAREIMQLFSIGLVELFKDGSMQIEFTNGDNGLAVPVPVATYSDNDVIEAARIMTGYDFAVWEDNAGNPHLCKPLMENHVFGKHQGNSGNQRGYTFPMKFFPQYHDGLAKTVMGQEYPEISGANYDSALNNPSASHLPTFIDQLAGHPNIGPFIGRRMIQRMVTSNPSRAYLYRVTRAFEKAPAESNMLAMLTAVLMDPEARDIAAPGTVARARFGKKRSPLEMTYTFARAMDAQSGWKFSYLDQWIDSPPAEFTQKWDPAIFYYAPAITSACYYTAGGGIPRNYQIDGGSSTEGIIQVPFMAPSVFNWYLPDYIESGSHHRDAGMFAPEFQILNDHSIMNVANYFQRICKYGSLTGSTQTFSEDVVERHPYLIALGINCANATSRFDQGPTLNHLARRASDVRTEAAIDGITDEAEIVRLIAEDMIDYFDLVLTAGNLAERMNHGPAAFRNEHENMRRIMVNGCLPMIQVIQSEGQPPLWVHPPDSRIVQRALFYIVQSPFFHIQS